MSTQVLLHLTGDYIIQNGWMAANKKKRGWLGHLACQMHCITYSLPFLAIGTWQAVVAIYATHFLLDRYRIVDWFIAIRERTFSIRNMGFADGVPPHMSAWLYIITDNVFHLTCNHFALATL